MQTFAKMYAILFEISILYTKTTIYCAEAGL